ncbi:bifunctional diguanylate cyclase/phosphodiesterase [Massilia sp. YMA4]|uniref:putative bifunctional diguanylate cyclase/phosphodiesterase n=1 Tax=Massilia sp. YMA4 TaxID=1593482 RepID=UPI000DD17DFD|nr:EAL domain-containing protein [Massilia sp. YMA4]AXA91279.1 GGDEF-domain containing protein [Massilia sp. YMA4]
MPHRKQAVAPGQQITRTLGAGQLAAAISALVFVGAILLACEWVALRGALADETRMQAAIVADNVAASLMFGDQQAAGEMLASLRQAGHLRTAALYSRDGRLFARYVAPAHAHRAGLGAAMPAVGTLAVTHPVSYRGQALGRLELVTGADRIVTGLLRYAGLLVLASLGGLLVVAVVMYRTRARVAAAERELHYLASTDAVTGLPNRRATYQWLEQAIADHRDGQVAVLLVDLDNFKLVNDTAGHAAGDVLLRQVAAALGGVVRPPDLVGRIGGDEFAVIAEVADTAGAQAIGERLLAALRKPFALASGEVFATASVGLCLYPQDAPGMTELLSSADAALYRAKSAGRNRLVAFVPEMTLAAQRRAQLEAELRRAIEQEALLPYYQPQFDCRTGAMVGVEALLRWPHPERGFVSPAEFIPVAEDTGLIVELGRWVLRRACADVAAWDRAGAPPLTVAVNVSARQLKEPDFLGDVLAALHASGLAPGRLELELTESLLMDDVECAVAFMHAVRAAGVRLSIDDFGTGYSSLAYLQSFPINQLKVDRKFVQSLPVAGHTIATAVIALARGFGLAVVAEGVERQEQLDWLRAAGCDHAQGFLLGMPMPAAQLLATATAPRAAALT